MPGKVIFTKDLDYEVKRILSLSQGYDRKIYVYSPICENVELFKPLLPDFIFIPQSNTFDPIYSNIFIKNTNRDFFVLKNIRLSDIMDKTINAYQDILKGYKLVIDKHPFLGKKDIYWCYFLWSFFDRSLLGYPHCYAFRDTQTRADLDPKEIVKKISSLTETTIRKIFEDDIVIKRISMDEESFKLYWELKEKLKMEGTKPFLAMNKLSNLVKDRYPILKKGLNIANLAGVFKAYDRGERKLFLSDAKIYEYLENEFWSYVRLVNIFMESLWNYCHHE